MADGLKIEYVKPADLKPAPYNPRTISDEALQRLARLLDVHGFVDPIIARAEDKLIIGGHQRLKANSLREDPDSAVPVVFLAGISDERAKALNVALNNQEASGEYDMPKLADLLQEIDTGEFDVPSFTAFSADDIAGLMHGLDEGFRSGEGSLASSIGEFVDEDGFFDCDDETRELLERSTDLVVQYSGGRDSSAVLWWVAHNYPSKSIHAVYVDTGVEFPGLGAHVGEAVESVGATLHVVKPALEWWDWIRRKGWPSLIYRPCLMKMIHEPFAKYIKATFDPTNTVILTGSRAEEAVRGSKKTARSSLGSFGAAADDWQHYAPCFAVKKDTLISVLQHSPMPEWEGYAAGFVRTACWCCPGQCGLQAKALQDNYPGLADEVRRWEQRIGPMRPLEDRNFDDLVAVGQRRSDANHG